jgi:hypothetical protein
MCAYIVCHTNSAVSRHGRQLTHCYAYLCRPVAMPAPQQGWPLVQSCQGCALSFMATHPPAGGLCDYVLCCPTLPLPPPPKACGSAGTTAGLALGAKLSGLCPEVHGYSSTSWWPV